MTVRLFDLEFEEVTLDQAVDQVLLAAKARRKGLIVTPNVDHIVRMIEDPETRAIYKRALHRYADGMPLVWLSRRVAPPRLPERVTVA